MAWRAALLLSLLPLAGAAAPVDDGDALVVVTAHWRDRAELQRIAAHFQHLIVDEKAHTARAEAGREDYLALRRAGIRVEIDDTATLRLRRAEAALHAAFTARQPRTRSQVQAQAQAAQPLVVTLSFTSDCCVYAVADGDRHISELRVQGESMSI